MGQFRWDIYFAMELKKLDRDIDKIWRERIVKTNLDLIILWLLKNKPRWGYEINMAIKDRFNVYLSAGTLYPLLHSLEEKRYIEGLWESEKGRGRRIYQITPEGEEYLLVGERISNEFLKKILPIA